MGGVSDREQARSPPSSQSIERYREQLHLVPVPEGVGDGREVRSGSGHIIAECGNALLADFVSRALRDDVGALPVIAAVYLHDECARTEGPPGFVSGSLVL